MARIFISYSRVDKPFTELFVDRLTRMFPDVEIWYDDKLYGGEIWWETILDQIAQCDLFIYLLSNESVQSPYCQAEFTEARRLQKRVITVQIRDRTELTDELDDIQYVDMKNGVDDPTALTSLSGAVRLQLSRATKKRPLWQPRTAKPETVKEPSRPTHAPEVDTPTLRNPAPDGIAPERPWYRDPRFIIGSIMIPILAVVIASLLESRDNGGNGSNNTPEENTPVVQQSTDTTAFAPSQAPMDLPGLSTTEIEQTVVAEMNLALTEDAQAAKLQKTQEASNLTATASLWTPTPTLDVRATARARLAETQAALDIQATFDAGATATQWSLDQTTAAITWTETPQATVIEAPDLIDCDQYDLSNLRIGLVTDVGEIDDKSFNQSAWEGVLSAETCGATVDYIETQSAKDYLENIAEFAENDYSIIVTVGYALGTATAEVAAQYPNFTFIGVDQPQEEALPNVVGLVFHEDHSGYLAGVLAARLTQTNVIAAVLGSDQAPPIVAFKEGYEAGARATNPDLTIISTYYPGPLDDAFTDPEWGATVAKQALDQNADVVFAAGGNTGNAGLIEVAFEVGKYGPPPFCIGVDRDQWLTLPEAHDCLISSAMKLIDVGVADIIMQIADGKVPAGNFYGQATLAPFHDLAQYVPEDVVADLETIKAGLTDGSISVGG